MSDAEVTSEVLDELQEDSGTTNDLPMTVSVGGHLFLAP